MQFAPDSLIATLDERHHAIKRASLIALRTGDPLCCSWAAISGTPYPDEAGIARNYCVAMQNRSVVSLKTSGNHIVQRDCQVNTVVGILKMIVSSSTYIPEFVHRLQVWKQVIQRLFHLVGLLCCRSQLRLGQFLLKYMQHAVFAYLLPEATGSLL